MTICAKFGPVCLPSISLSQTKRVMNEIELLKDLPNYLCLEIELDEKTDLVEQMSLSKGRCKILYQLCDNESLAPCVFLPDSIIVTKDDIRRDIYFIATESVQIILDSDPLDLFTDRIGNQRQILITVTYS